MEILLSISSLCMLAVIFLGWRQRSTEGFRFGKNVKVHIWTLLEIAQLFAILLIAVGLVILAHGILHTSKLLETAAFNALFMVASQIFLQALLLALVLQFLRHKKISWSEAFGFKATTIPHALLTAGVTLMAIFLPIVLLAYAAYIIFTQLGLSTEPQSIVQIFTEVKNFWVRTGLIFTATVGAPFAEEIFFRGMLYPYLKKQWGMFHALWISSIMFAAIHQHAASVLPLFALAIVLTLLYEWRGNLAACIAMHASFNALNLAILFLIDKKPSLS